MKKLLLVLSVVPMALTPSNPTRGILIVTQNACVMYKMRAYISLLEDLRRRRCAYTRDVRKLEVTLRQLFIIMGEKCHGVRNVILP
uniref:Uncharacterized protein n=1 Tax=Fundulus heteroclitus TaxID=8078 RepID=A0A3Q2QPW3_FUNHE